MSGGLEFHEVMEGKAALGASDPAEGAQHPAAGRLAVHCDVRIDDLERFVADPQHTGTIGGSVDFAPWADGIPVTNGIFNLFSPEGEQRVMEYRLGFEHEGRSYYLDGRKFVHDDPGFDVWKDTTTLYTVMHEGPDTSGPVVAAGVITIGVEALARMVASMRPTGGGGIGSFARFGRLFLSELWDTYGADKLPGGGG
jgi:hypothetical protein